MPILLIYVHASSVPPVFKSTGRTLLPLCIVHSLVPASLLILKASQIACVPWSLQCTGIPVYPLHKREQYLTPFPSAHLLSVHLGSKAAFQVLVVYFPKNSDLNTLGIIWEIILERLEAILSSQFFLSPGT